MGCQGFVWVIETSPFQPFSPQASTRSILLYPVKLSEKCNVLGLTKRRAQDLLLLYISCDWKSPGCGHVCPLLHIPVPPSLQSQILGKLREENHKFKSSLSKLVRCCLQGKVILFSSKRLNCCAMRFWAQCPGKGGGNPVNYDFCKSVAMTAP